MSLSLRPISHAALEAAVFDSLFSDTLFDELHAGGAVPDPKISARRVADDISDRLGSLAARDRLDLGIRRDVPYRKVWPAARGTWPAVSIDPEHGMPTAICSIVAYDASQRLSFMVFEVFGRWDEAECLEALYRLSRLLYFCHGEGGGRGTLQLTGLVCYHSHREEPGEPPWHDFDPGRLPSLRQGIESAVGAHFGEFSKNLTTIVAPDVMAFSCDRWGTLPGTGDGAVTGAFVQFNAFPERFAPPRRA